MLFRSLRWFCRPAVDLEHLQPTEIKWFRMNNMYWLEVRNPGEMIFPLLGNMTFRQMLAANATYDPHLTLPEGVTMDTPVTEFLCDSHSPKIVNATINGKPFFFRNMASFPYNMAFKRVQTLHRNIHNLIRSNVADHGLSMRQASVMSYYELLFAKEAAKLPPESNFTEEDRRNIMLKIMDSYRVLNPQKLWNLKIEELQMDKIIGGLDIKIDKFEAGQERTYRRYKMAIALVSIAHILGFGYAIFFVDYLGWDIMEPLTYTIGLLGSILAIFFFIRHHRDRSHETIKETFKRIITKSSDRVWLESIKNKRNFYAEERDRVRYKIQILQMRSDFGYFKDKDVMDNTPPKDELIDSEEEN